MIGTDGRLNFLHSRGGHSILTCSRLTLSAVALIIWGTARADLPEFDEAIFEHGLFHNNFFNWVDFDSDDTAKSFPALHPQDVPNGVIPYAQERYVHDDNVFRLPTSGPSPLQVPVVSRGDDINTLTAGIDGYLAASGQAVELLARADQNRFSRNSSLDNTSASARLLGDWEIGSALSGQVGASYDRQLNDFANYQLYTKDILSAESVFTSAHLDMGSWTFDASGRGTEISHSSDNVKYRNNGAKAVATYETPGGTYIGAIYQYTNGRFPLPQFAENAFSLQVDSPLGRNFRFHAAGGYLEHDYSQITTPTPTANINFSGGIWNAQLAWQPSEPLQLMVAGSREVHAYIDAQSQYFVSQAARAAASWAPTGKLTLMLEYTREDQHFIGPGPTVISLRLPEHNILYSRQANLAWAIARPMQLVLSYRYVTRSSNAPVLAFNDSLLSLSLRGRF